MENPSWYAHRSQILGGKDLAALNVPVLSLSERDGRWSRLKEKMHLHGLDALVMVGSDVNSGMGMANVRYVTQIGTMLGAYVVFPLVGSPTMFYGAPHMHLPGSWQRVPGRWLDDVRPVAGVRGVLEAIAERGLSHAHLGLVGHRDMLSAHTQLPAFFVDRLRRELGGAVISDATSLLEEMRTIKSEEELGFLRRAGEVARRRIDRLAETARAEATEADVWAAMDHEMIIAGGEPSTFNMLSSGPAVGLESDSRVMGLLHGSEVPFTGTMRELSEGDLVICAFQTSYGGYLASTEFSVFLGEAPPELLRLHEAGAQIIRMAEELFVPERPLREIYTTFHDFTAEEGLDFVKLGFHGQGLASPEFPTMVYRDTPDQPLARRGLGDLRLREDMVFGLSVDLHDPSWRTDVGLMIGDTVRVTPAGGEYLCGIPLDLFEVAP